MRDPETVARMVLQSALAWDDCYEWARERLPAAAEKEHGG